MVQDEITVITGIDWCVRFRVKAQCHDSIASRTINLKRHSFSRVLYFNSNHDVNLCADVNNTASTFGGGRSQLSLSARGQVSGIRWPCCIQTLTKHLQSKNQPRVVIQASTNRRNQINKKCLLQRAD
jgi:hypothetical protein